ncbi:hypothetical protein [Alsobacter sp. R-9]
MWKFPLLTGALVLAAASLAAPAPGWSQTVREPAEHSGGGAGNPQSGEIRSREGAPARGAGTSGIRLPRGGDGSVAQPAEQSGGGAGNPRSGEIRSGEGAPPLAVPKTRTVKKKRAGTDTTGSVRR